MKKGMMLFLALAVLAGAMFAVTSVAAVKGDKVTIKGEVVDLWCYMSAGARGADHKACAVACAKAGLPIGIVDEKGDVYLAMGGGDQKNAKDLLVGKMADTVEVTGVLVKKGNLSAIYIESVK